MDIVERLRKNCTCSEVGSTPCRFEEECQNTFDGADEIERLRTKQKIAVEMVKELLDFLEFIYNHSELENSLKAYEWIMFQIEMIMAKYNEPVGEER
jgi:hypothetical protein